VPAEVLVERPGRKRVPRQRREPAAAEPFAERWRWKRTSASKDAACLRMRAEICIEMQVNAGTTGGCPERV
jgi:hypothetical protein